VIYEFIGSFNFFLCFIFGYSKINLSSTRMKVDFDGHPINFFFKKENILRYRDQFEKF
jgi:hypothetical protein